jgi:hypothetical protein
VGVDRARIRRSLRVKLLARDIIEAIVAGREPSGLSLARLRGTVPMGCEERRDGLHFPSAS